MRHTGHQHGDDDEHFQVSETDMLAVDCDHPRCIKLLVGSTDGGAGEEAVLRLQGIMAKSALPPVRAQPK